MGDLTFAIIERVCKLFTIASTLLIILVSSKTRSESSWSM